MNNNDNQNKEITSKNDTPKKEDLDNRMIFHKGELVFRTPEEVEQRLRYRYNPVSFGDDEDDEDGET